MKKQELKLGIALSGGGVRAAVFHLGVLARCAADDLLENITFLSTVSGGTLITGLIYSVAGYKWPSSEYFLHDCLPRTKHLLTRTNVEGEAKLRLFYQPWYLILGRAKLIAKSIEHSWHVTGQLNDIPPEPRWILNATTYESGKNWRFIPQKRMGDYVVNYVDRPPFPLAQAMAASAAVPVLIGPLTLETNRFQWFKYGAGNRVEETKPSFKHISLWDGAIYDNLGVEALFKVRGGYRDEYNFLVVSDASAPLKLETSSLKPWKRYQRLMFIAMDQVRGIRARTLVNRFQDHENSGVYLKMGNTSYKILKDADFSRDTIELLTGSCLSKSQVAQAAEFATTLRQLTEAEYDLLYQHGWEVANFTLQSRCPKLFQHMDSTPVPQV